MTTSGDSDDATLSVLLSYHNLRLVTQTLASDTGALSIPEIAWRSDDVMTSGEVKDAVDNLVDLGLIREIAVDDTPPENIPDTYYAASPRTIEVLRERGLWRELGMLYLQLEPGVVSGCDGREYRRASDYPIQLHDILADLRTRGIVTNLAKTGCDYCGHAAGKEHAIQLRDRGLAVRGYAGIAANSHPEDPRISIQDFDWSDWDASDVRELVEERANAHHFQTKIHIEQAETLKH